MIEGISDYIRVHEMFSILETPHARANERAEGFGGNVDMFHLCAPALLPGVKYFEESASNYYGVFVRQLHTHPYDLHID